MGGGDNNEICLGNVMTTISNVLNISNAYAQVYKIFMRKEGKNDI